MEVAGRGPASWVRSVRRACSARALESRMACWNLPFTECGAILPQEPSPCSPGLQIRRHLRV